MELMRASMEWASRPDDQRYTSLESLYKSVLDRKNRSRELNHNTKKMIIHPQNSNLYLHIVDEEGQQMETRLTHHSFAQLATIAQAPPSYLRSLPPDLAAQNVQYGLNMWPNREDIGMLIHQSQDGEFSTRGITSPRYGRIWDEQVVGMVMRINQDGNWKIPSASYASKDPLKATTLYASDRDVFMFLVDDQHAIDVKGNPMYRGFYTWNSETGNSVFGLTTFLYSYVCDNRIIWGATDVKELKIRHNSGAPSRFAMEGIKYLEQYANEGTKQITSGIKAAMNTRLPLRKGQTNVEWIENQDFTRAEAAAAVVKAEEEEGQCDSIWDVINGVTAYARNIQHTDARVNLETRAGRLMKYAKVD